MLRASSSRVLVVEDEPAARSALAHTIRGVGLTPVVAATVEEAVALSEGDQLHAVVADLEVPGMSSWALLQRLSLLQPGVKFVVVTGGVATTQESLPRGHRTHIFRKPWLEDEMAAAILDDRAPGPSSFPPASDEVLRPSRVLLVEDDEGDACLFRAALREACPGQFVVEHALTLDDAQVRISSKGYDVVALDLGLGETNGLATIARFQSQASHLGLVVLSGRDDPSLALRALQAGAQDYLVKGITAGSEIGRALRYAEQRKRSELRLADLAFNDQLTGLANRTLFRQRVAQALVRCARVGGSFAILVIDIDRFKSVNDALGHDAGDVYLRRLADRLREATRKVDTVARLGGDEFAVLADCLERPEEVERLATRILLQLGQPMQLGGIQIAPSASIGAALYPSSGEDSDSLLAAADAAMYAVKSKGRNAFELHGVELTEQMTRRLRLDSALRKAIDDQKLALWYQPQVSTTGDFCGAEALLRWETDSGETLPAADFVPALEDSGLIVELGPWIMQTACHQLAEWRANGLRVDRLAVNLSAKQFVSSEFYESLRSAIEVNGLRAADLELELTETALLRDDDGTLQLLEKLSSEGFRIALDDFGTGYCSLAYLQRFPINTVKIDKSFVSEIGVRSRQRNLVGAIVQLANRLEIDVIAEGVESESQLSVLNEEGCHTVQGFLVGPAVPQQQFAAWVQQHAALRSAANDA